MPEDQAPRYLGLTHGFDRKPKRRLFEVLKSQGLQANQEVTFLTDGGDEVRALTELVTPLKPLEAMAQGKLVAASAVGGHRELIADGLTGTLFAADDPAACATALAELLANREVWDARRIAGRAHVAVNHDWARNIHRYQDVYQRLITRSLDSAIRKAA